MISNGVFNYFKECLIFCEDVCEEVVPEDHLFHL